MKYIVILLFIIILSNRAETYAQDSLATDTVEVSMVDVTGIVDFSAKKASVFGLKIGMRINDAKAEIEKFNTYKLRLEQDKYNNNRLYLYELIGNDSIKNPIGLCKWESANSGMNELILYEDAAECLAGDIYKLFSAGAIDSSANVFPKQFLGEPSKVVVDLDLPSLGLKSTRYYFAKRALIVIENKKPEKTTFHLAFYKSLL